MAKWRFVCDQALDLVSMPYREEPKSGRTRCAPRKRDLESVPIVETKQEEKQASNRRSILRSSLIFSALTFLSRILGYTRDLVRAVLLGTSHASDAYGIAITIPNLFRRLVGEGAMTAAFIPVFTDQRKKDKEQWQAYIHSFFTLLTILLTVLTVLGVALAPWYVPEIFARGFADAEPAKAVLTVRLTQWMFAYIFFISLAALVQGILNTFGRFGPSAFTPVLLNLSIILCALLIGRRLEQPAYGFVAGFLIGGAL